MRHFKRILGLLGIAFVAVWVYWGVQANHFANQRDNPGPRVIDFGPMEAEAQSVGGPANFPYGIYNGCSGGLVASAGIATGTAVAPCNVAQLHGCMAQAGTNITPVPGDVSNCQVTTFGIVTVVGTASATVTVTGIKIIMATAGAAGATQKWIGY